MLSTLPLLLVAPWIAISDLRFHRVPNRSLVALFLAIEALSLLQSHPLPIQRYLFGLLVFALSLVFNASAGWPVGMGDLKLFAISCLLLGSAERAFSALLIASLCGLCGALCSQRRVIPFAPAILIGSLATLLSG